MSAGHHKHAAIESKEVERALDDPQVKVLLARQYNLNRDYDLPYLGGYSKDGMVIYIDRHLPQSLGFDSFLETHEHIEKSIIDGLGFKYLPAHEIATSVERRQVVAAGINWKKYSDILQPYIKADEIEKLEKVPPDLDMTPYDSTPENKKLVERMKQAQGE